MDNEFQEAYATMAYFDSLNRHNKSCKISQPKIKKMTKESRAISTIAKEIKSDWKKVYFGAVPYLDAMLQLDKITDRYYEDSALSIVAYFLANAGTWRGEVARRVKAELNAMVK